MSGGYVRRSRAPRAPRAPRAMRRGMGDGYGYGDGYGDGYGYGDGDGYGDGVFAGEGAYAKGGYAKGSRLTKKQMKSNPWLRFMSAWRKQYRGTPLANDMSSAAIEYHKLKK